MTPSAVYDLGAALRLENMTFRSCVLKGLDVRWLDPHVLAVPFDIIAIIVLKQPLLMNDMVMQHSRDTESVGSRPVAVQTHMAVAQTFPGKGFPVR